jgi:Tfp pilus assembly protein PilP
MKSAFKGIEMKLIQILALATAMATMATAQNSGAQSQGSPSPTPTPASKVSGPGQPATKKTGKSGPQSGSKSSAGTPAAATGKPGVKATAAPAKGQTPAATSAKGTPTPVVSAIGAAKATDTKKTDSKKTEGKKTEAKKTEAKKTDTKKSAPAKAPAVIAVQPAQTTKKAPKVQASVPAKSPAKTPAKAPAPQVTQVGPSAKQVEKPRASTRAFGAHGRRDPFVSPIVADKGGFNRPPSNCTSGKRCLVIPELVLQGTVKDTSGKMMAVVANSTRRTYFLRENDQVFQGSVEKITSDSIIFREYIKDALGRETAREVVKKLVPTT